ncbi:MAG: hypothetical protein Q8O47_05980 [Candidatus Bathyarchaeota archaeon]|nr:hypothetical protein [Candidatus Bathyarchaeota archaeon]
MRCGVILHAPIGGGKTTTASTVAERARSSGAAVYLCRDDRVAEVAALLMGKAERSSPSRLGTSTPSSA